MAILTPTKSVLTDTCFWFALYDQRDQYHKRALTIYDNIEKARIIIPWPCLYEVLNTRFIKNRIWLKRFELLLKKPNVHCVDDKEFKEMAIEDIFLTNPLKARNISLVDSVIRQILTVSHLKIDYLVTFNEADFLDIIKKRPHIEIYY
jgi:predicted nucleic acid-binding protein